jgi:hypothetical protein
MMPASRPVRSVAPDEDAIVAWRKAQELCERPEREAEADEEMSLEQYCQKIKPGITALKDYAIKTLRDKLVKKLSRDAQREPPPSDNVVVPLPTWRGLSANGTVVLSVAGVGVLAPHGLSRLLRSLSD